MRCETIVRLISHSSSLKVDDVRLIGSAMFSKFCGNFDHEAMDDLRHLVMQCPKWPKETNEMLAAIVGGCGGVLLASQCDLVLALKGKMVEGLSNEQMIKIWTNSAEHITKMYNNKIKEGIG